jgi:hypothetical protein
MNATQERKMFGCTLTELREGVENSLPVKLNMGSYSMVAMSMLSDAQEEIECHRSPGMREQVRQTINRAKWVIAEYLIEDRGAGLAPELGVIVVSLGSACGSDLLMCTNIKSCPPETWFEVVSKGLVLARHDDHAAAVDHYDYISGRG